MGRWLELMELAALSDERCIQAGAYARIPAPALPAGRVPPHATVADQEQAKRELTSQSDLARQEAIVERRWKAMTG